MLGLPCDITSRRCFVETAQITSKKLLTFYWLLYAQLPLLQLLVPGPLIQEIVYEWLFFQSIHPRCLLQWNNNNTHQWYLVHLIPIHPPHIKAQGNYTCYWNSGGKHTKYSIKHGIWDAVVLLLTECVWIQNYCNNCGRGQVNVTC